MAEDRQDAQHPASAIRLQQAHAQGDFPRSVELAHSFQLMCGVASCYFLMGSFANQLKQLTVQLWSRNPLESGLTAPGNLLWQILLIASPLLLMFFVVSVISHVVQNTSFVFFNKPLFNTSSLNPATNARRIFSLESSLRSVLGIPKVTVIFGVTFLSIWFSARSIIELPYQDISEVPYQLLKCLFQILFASAATMFLLSVLDYAIERISFANRHRMTDEDLREENRLQNADPQISVRRQKLYQDLT